MGKQKRKLIVDEVTSISGEEMKIQLSDTADIVATLDFTPPTKKLMHWKETYGVEKIFALPGHPILSTTLSKGFTKHLTTRLVDNEDFFKEDSNGEIKQEKDEDKTGSCKNRKSSHRFPPNYLLPLTSRHLKNSRTSFKNDSALSHPFLNVPNFLKPQYPVFPPVQHGTDQSQQQILTPRDDVMQKICYNEL